MNSPEIPKNLEPLRMSDFDLERDKRVFPWERLQSLTPELQQVSQELSSWFSDQGWQHEHTFAENDRDISDYPYNRRRVDYVFFNPKYEEGHLPEAKALLSIPHDALTRRIYDTRYSLDIGLNKLGPFVVQDTSSIVERIDQVAQTADEEALEFIENLSSPQLSHLSFNTLISAFDYGLRNPIGRNRVVFKLNFVDTASLIEAKIENLQNETVSLRERRRSLRQILQKTQKRLRFLREKQPNSLLLEALDRLKKATS